MPRFTPVVSYARELYHIYIYIYEEIIINVCLLRSERERERRVTPPPVVKYIFIDNTTTTIEKSVGRDEIVGLLDSVV